MKTLEAEPLINKSPHGDCCIPSGGIINFAQAEPGEVCIDLGSGNGTNVLRMATDVGSNGFVFGLEKSDDLIKKAFIEAEHSGITNVDFIHSSLETIKLGNGIANLLISSCAIHRVVHKQHIWGEIYRVLKEGGRFIVSDIYITPNVAEEYQHTSTTSNCREGALTRGEYLDMLYNAGFVSVRILEESVPYTKGQATIVSFTLRGEKPGEPKAGRCRI
jgi:ubiquinone/menaquinone biosynthesis C-methylase UbiE